MNKVLQYQSILQNLQCILVQPVKLFSAQRGCIGNRQSGDFFNTNPADTFRNFLFLNFRFLSPPHCKEGI